MGGNSRSVLWTALIVLAFAPPSVVLAQPFPPLESSEPPLAGPPPIAAPVAPAEPADPPSPAVTVHVRAPANAAVGQEVDYRILVTNPSQASAYHVRVRSAVPAAATFVRASPEPASRDPQVVWELETMPPGTSKELLLTLKPTGAGDVDVTARVQFEHGESVRTHIGAAAPAPTTPAAPAAPVEPARVALHLRATGPAKALVGDLITLELNVTNTGTEAATDVELDDSLPDGLELWSGTDNAIIGKRRVWKIDRLAPGQTEVRDLEAFARSVGDQQNVVQATAAGGLRETASCTVRVDEPKLKVAISGPEKGLLNRRAKYEITVTNAGPAPLTNVEVRAELPGDVQLSGPPNHDGRQDKNSVRWLLGEAPPGKQAILTIELTAAREMEAAVHVTARADRGVADQAEVKTHFEGAAGLRVDIDKTEDPVEAGHVVVYTVRVLNRGSAAARNLQLSATIPDQMQAVETNNANSPPQIGRTLTFPALAILDAGKETTYTIRLRALRAGEVKVAVELQSDDLATSLHEEETTTVFGEASPASGSPASPLPGPNLPGGS